MDQHALRRNRHNRLLGVLNDHPEPAAGVAIDEATTLIVDPRAKRREAEGASYVVLRSSQDPTPPLRIDVLHAGRNMDGSGSGH